MATGNVTFTHDLNFCNPYYSSIFQDNRLSEEARRLLDPVWKAEKSMRLEIINRINTVLYDRHDTLTFGFAKQLNVYWHYRSYRVTGVRCEVYQYRKDLRVLKAVLTDGSRTTEVNCVYALGINELIKLYEMVARTLNPRDDNPGTTV